MKQKKRNAWQRIGLSARELADVVTFDCEPVLETRIEALAVRDSKFWLAYGDLVQPEFFATDMARHFMRLVHDYSEGTTVPDHPIARDLALRSPLVPDAQRSDLLMHIDLVYSQPLTAIAYTTALVKDMARKRAMRGAVVRIAQLNEASDPNSDPTDEIEQVMQAALSIGARDSNPVIDFKTDFHLLPQWVSGAAAVPTFIPALDTALCGGLVKGELGVVLAPPHRGKSLTLVNLAIGAVSCARSVLYISLEDGVSGVGPRLYARITGTPVNTMRDNMAPLQSELRRLLPMFQGELKIVYRPPGKTSIRDIRSLLDRLNNESGFKPDVLIIDYADRLSAPRERSRDDLELTDIYMSLRCLGQEYDTATWTASQSKVAAFHKDIFDIDDAAGSQGKAAEADVIMIYCQTPEERLAGEARFHLGKTRNRSSGGVVHVHVNRATSTILEVPQAQLAGLVCNQKKQKKKINTPKPPPIGSPIP